jgi:hypothetical protein
MDRNVASIAGEPAVGSQAMGHPSFLPARGLVLLIHLRASSTHRAPITLSSPNPILRA